MSKCKWRDKPGADENCGFLASVGRALCPRHEYLAKLKEEADLERERAALVKRKALSGVRPNNRRALLEQGYQPIGNGSCSSCNAPVEWFRTRNGNKSPYNPMADLDSPAVSHFATCTHAALHRRAS